METKTCPRCGEVKELDEFGANRSRRDGRQGACRECMKTYRRDHYKANKQTYVDRSARQKEELLNEVRALKESTPCTDCGENYPYYVMDFDHLNGDKIDNVNRLIQTRGRKGVMAEIAKCEIVCSNCHRIRTRKRRIALLEIPVVGFQ